MRGHVLLLIFWDVGCNLCKSMVCLIERGFCLKLGRFGEWFLVLVLGALRCGGVEVIWG